MNKRSCVASSGLVQILTYKGTSLSWLGAVCSISKLALLL